MTRNEHSEARVEPSDTSASRGTVRWIIETLAMVAVAFFLAQAVRAYAVAPFIVPSESMVPTMRVSDRFLADRFTYRFLHQPKPGDIVIFDEPGGKRTFVKRVIATGGQTVDVHDGHVYVDGKRLNEPYTHGANSQPGDIGLPIKIPAGSVWLMGDNRTNSTDSRWFGPVPLSTVRGHAVVLYWPLSRAGALH
jgi:signal peptidase I